MDTGDIAELQRELFRQWSINHAEHCGKQLEAPLPHAGDCYWPLPRIASKFDSGVIAWAESERPLAAELVADLDQH